MLQIGFMRIKGLMRKETLQIVRDPSSIAIAFILPMVLLLIFGYGVSLDAEHVPLALVTEKQSPQASSFFGSFYASRYFEPLVLPDIHEAQEAMKAGRVDAIIWLRNDFAETLLSSRSSSIGFFVNGVDANNARIIEGYVQGVWANWLTRYAAVSGQSAFVPAVLEQRVWFNQELRSRNFLVPGLIAVIMTLIGALLTAMVVAREWERGTMEALMVTPVTVREILLGKFIPYFVLGMGGMVLSVCMAVWLFGIPLRGSVWVLFGTSALFLLVALGMGLLISTAARSQFVAAQTAIVVTYLPAFILSGFIFDINSMPKPIQAVTYLIAARYYVAILKTVFLAGDVWPVIIPNALALLLMGAIFLVAVKRRTRKRLD